ncbi:NADP-dependent oxidoreductase [Cellulomonas sp. APG4]|nr:NADP-dependent oxidoreductase [Cellulomonas sp. APG4]
MATAYGGPDVLRVVEHDPGLPGPGEALVEMRAAGVNPADWKTYSGAWGDDEARLPLRLGFELAGTVLEAGEGVDRAWVGQEVVAHPVSGAYADRVLVRASRLVPRPAALDVTEAGALLLAGTTALHALDAAGVGAGDTVLVHGASGGVGSMVTQLALRRGARVVGTASRAKHDDVVELGATAITYGPGLHGRVEQAAPGGLTAAIDTVGTDEALDTSVALVADRRRVVTIVAAARGTALGVTVMSGNGGLTAEQRARAREHVASLAAAGHLRVRVGAVYHLADVVQAHRSAMSGTRGRVVLVP